MSTLGASGCPECGAEQLSTSLPIYELRMYADRNREKEDNENYTLKAR